MCVRAETFRTGEQSRQAGTAAEKRLKSSTPGSDKPPSDTPPTPHLPHRSRPQPHQHQLLQLVLPCLVLTLHRHTAIRVTMCPTSTRAGNTFPGGLVSIGPAHEWTVPGSAVRWGGVKGEEREGGGGVWCHSGVLVLQPSLSVTFERESSREQSSPPPALPLSLPTTPAPVFLFFFLSF